MEDVIEKIVAHPDLHSKWLNTLSMMENAGAKKIKKCEDPIFVNEIILKHAAEEARHAYYLKKQISKIKTKACPTYEKKYLLAPNTSYYYLNELDVQICRYLKDKFGYTKNKLKYAAYLLVTYAIEVRADHLYPIYQKVLIENKSNVTVHGIIAEEKNHLEEMISQLKEFSPDWQTLTADAVEFESKLFGLWQKDLKGFVAE